MCIYTPFHSQGRYSRPSFEKRLLVSLNLIISETSSASLKFISVFVGFHKICAHLLFFELISSQCSSASIIPGCSQLLFGACLNFISEFLGSHHTRLFTSSSSAGITMETKSWTCMHVYLFTQNKK